MAYQYKITVRLMDDQSVDWTMQGETKDQFDGIFEYLVETMGRAKYIKIPQEFPDTLISFATDKVVTFMVELLD